MKLYSCSYTHRQMEKERRACTRSWYHWIIHPFYKQNPLFISPILLSIFFKFIFSVFGFRFSVFGSVCRSVIFILFVHVFLLLLSVHVRNWMKQRRTHNTIEVKICLHQILLCSTEFNETCQQFHFSHAAKRNVKINRNIWTHWTQLINNAVDDEKNRAVVFVYKTNFKLINVLLSQIVTTFYHFFVYFTDYSRMVVRLKKKHKFRAEKENESEWVRDGEKE